MSESAATAPLPRIEPGDTRGLARAQACNRIILYARGMDLAPEACLRLAAESLDHAGPDAGLEAILGRMHGILAARGMDPGLPDPRGEPIHGGPPLRRSSMVSQSEYCRSFLGWIGGALGGMARALAPSGMTWRRRKA